MDYVQCDIGGKMISFRPKPGLIVLLALIAVFLVGCSLENPDANISRFFENAFSDVTNYWNEIGQYFDNIGSVIEGITSSLSGIGEAIRDMFGNFSLF